MLVRGLLAPVALALALMAGACEPLPPIEGAWCNTQRPCPDGYACRAGECRKLVGHVILGCREDAECAPGACHVEAGLCVQCMKDDDCLTGSCLPGLHLCGCTEHAHCRRTGRCDLQASSCVSCFSDAQCPSGQCNEAAGVCVPEKIDRRSDGGS